MLQLLWFLLTNLWEKSSTCWDPCLNVLRVWGISSVMEAEFSSHLSKHNAETENEQLCFSVWIQSASFRRRRTWCSRTWQRRRPRWRWRSRAKKPSKVPQRRWVCLTNSWILFIKFISYKRKYFYHASFNNHCQFIQPAKNAQFVQTKHEQHCDKEKKQKIAPVWCNLI